MTSNEDERDTLFQTIKKRRMGLACDLCKRQEKVQCDGVTMPGTRCSNCLVLNTNCTYVEAAKKWSLPHGYIERLENSLEKLDKLLRRLCPDESLYQQLIASIDTDQPPSDPSSIALELFQPSNFMTPLQYVTTVISHSDKDLPEDDEVATPLEDCFGRMALEPDQHRFFGKSSGASLVEAAWELKSEFIGQPEMDLRKGIGKPFGNHRAEFWTIRPWESKLDIPVAHAFNFPEPDLAEDCINLYFANLNLILPLLHRPTFEKAVGAGLHLSDTGFAQVYLLVCAVGSRFSSDPRILLDGVDSYHSAGWRWYNQVHVMHAPLLTLPTLYDLQRCCLSCTFLLGSSAPQLCWTIVGIGMRLAQDVGAHRRKRNSRSPTAEDELWKRAFWVLVSMDRIVSSALGRPCLAQDEDFDLDLPIDCDDEYWDHEDPEKRFKQPPNQPSQITSFTLLLKLHQIWFFTLRTIYAINKSKYLLALGGNQWEQQVVAELDSALNKWVDLVPDHLRWDPNRRDEVFFNQSVVLYSMYYHTQILVHRPFISSPKKPSPLAFPSLAICTNAARSCCHVIEAQRKRRKTGLTMPPVLASAFTAGVVLLLSIWGGKRSGLTTDQNKEMANVHICMKVLRDAEQRWNSAGRLWDIMYQLATVGELPLPQPSPPSNKREWSSINHTPSPASEMSSSSEASDGPRNIAGSRRVSQYRYQLENSGRAQQQSTSSVYLQSHSQIHQGPSSSISASPSVAPEARYMLPLYSSDLGRLPLHGGINFSALAPTHPHQQHPHSNPHYSSNVSTMTSPSEFSATSSPRAGGPDQVPSNIFRSLGDMSSMTHDYSMSTASLTTGMELNNMAGLPAFDPEFFSDRVDNPADSPAIFEPPGDPSFFSQITPAKEEHAFIDNDTIDMWLNTPTGYEMDDWDTYLANVSELTQGHLHSGSNSMDTYTY